MSMIGCQILFVERLQVLLVCMQVVEEKDEDVLAEESRMRSLLNHRTGVTPLLPSAMQPLYTLHWSSSSGGSCLATHLPAT
jgi:hypothetical protein